MKIIGDNMTPLFPVFQCDYWKQRMSFHFLILIGLLFISVSTFGQASISGLVTDKDTGEPILFGDIIIYQDGKLITGEQTNFDGNYIISPIDTGVYDIFFLYIGYTDLKIEGVIITDNKETTLDASITSGISISCPINSHTGTRRIIHQDDFDKGRTFTSRDIKRMPNKN